ncbi:hypothetical protein CRX72_29335 [Pantoea sp. BRM17]|nr:hypothetical protein CRX72_29335 [Pantoea sp. BRM17]
MSLELGGRITGLCQPWFTWFGLAVLWLLVQLPYPVLIRLGATAGKLSRHFLKRRERITRRNIELCFPHINEEEKEVMIAGKNSINPKDTKVSRILKALFAKVPVVITTVVPHQEPWTDFLARYIYSTYEGAMKKTGQFRSTLLHPRYTLQVDYFLSFAM